MISLVKESYYMALPIVSERIVELWDPRLRDKYYYVFSRFLKRI